jgi:SnoaL-like protein
MWKRFAFVVLIALSAVAFRAASAQSPASAPRELTALDYIEIQQLVAKYARAIDTCSNNGYDYADLFTPDGSFIPSFDGKPGAPIQGRERLAEVSGGGSRGCKNVGWIVQGVRHLYVNHIITPTAEGATGTVDMLMIGLGGDPYKIQYDVITRIPTSGRSADGASSSACTTRCFVRGIRQRRHRQGSSFVDVRASK